MKKTGIGLILFMCLTVLSSCGNEATKKEENSNTSKQEFTVTVKQEIPSIDASVTNDVVGWGVLKNVGEGLFRADNEGNLIPAGAAEEPVISDDGLTYTFKLRKDAQWSNGDLIVAEDYVYGWQRTAEPETASEVAYLFTAIENYDAIALGDLKAEELGIKALSDDELEIRLAYPVPYIQSLLSLPPFFPQNQKVVEEHGEEYANESSKAVYNGPFVLTDFEGAGVDTSWAYEKNENYWDKKNVKMDKIKVEVVKEDSTALNLFQDGQVDDIVISGELAQQMQTDEAFFSQEMSSVYYVEYNQDRENLKNQNLRKAISYAIDH